MKIVLFQRKANPHQFSIEKVFDGVKRYLAIGLKVPLVNKIMPYYSMGIAARFKNILWSRKHQGDVNHITGDIHYIALGLRANKTILTIHDLNFLQHPNVFVRWILKTFWLTLPLKSVSWVTVISQATKKVLLQRVSFSEDRIKVIPNYYDNRLTYCPKEFNVQEPRLLQIGTKQNKNVLRLIESIRDIRCYLTLIGAYDRNVEKVLKDYKIKYTWLNNLSDDELREQYILCDIVCLVSTSEGFGLPILEAQAVGRCVITSNISSMPEVAGDAACFVDPFDVDSIRLGINKIISDSTNREELIKKGLKNIERFSLSEIASQYMELYKQVANSTHL